MNELLSSLLLFFLIFLEDAHRHYLNKHWLILLYVDGQQVNARLLQHNFSTVEMTETHGQVKPCTHTRAHIHTHTHTHVHTHTYTHTRI